MGEQLTWREQIVCRILLVVAGMLAGDRAIAAEIKHLSNKITTQPTVEVER